MYKLLLVIALVFIHPLSAAPKVLAFAGSTRDDSCNKKLANEAAYIAHQQGATITVIDLSDYPIPLYDADLEASKGMPANAKTIRNMMIASNAIIISSPEYNGSLPAVLKNVIDWASRNEQGKPSRDAYSGKRFAIMSCSPGQGGGATGLTHLSQILERLGGTVISTQVTVPNAYSAFNPLGRLQVPALVQALDQEIKQLLQGLVAQPGGMENL